MPSARRQKPKAARAPAKRPAGRPAPKKKVRAKVVVRPTPKAKSKPPAPPRKSAVAAKGAAAPKAVPEVPQVRRSDGRIHVLSLSFVRDGDEFLARLETDGGQITELKNRSLDQLLTLVASELEDLLE